MIRKIILGSAVCLLLTNLLMVISCSSGGDEPPVGEPPQLVSSDPANGQTDVAEGITEITLRFNMNVTLAPSSLISLNGQKVTNHWRGQEGELKMTVPPLLPGTDYTLLVPAQTVKGPTGLSNPSEIRITFKTCPSLPPREGLSPQAEKLLQFLKQQEGKKTLSGTMAHVAWNINEAEWVHHHTGNWPAINCFTCQLDRLWQHHCGRGVVEQRGCRIGILALERTCQQRSGGKVFLLLGQCTG
jgi:mannan endo-1,4-beta-mannosidase